MNKAELILFSITVLSFGAGLLHRVWLISSAVSDVRHNLEKQDIRLENLNNLQQAGFTGFKERIEHFTVRTRGEAGEIDKRLDDVEGFLTKTTDFTRRR
jgi:hypothetical protein